MSEVDTNEIRENATMQGVEFSTAMVLNLCDGYDELRADLARRDEQIAEAEEYYQACMTIAILCEQAGIPNPKGTTVGIVKSALSELTRRDETIRKLKEDAERLYAVLADFEIYENFASLALHRALMAELNQTGELK